MHHQRLQHILGHIEPNQNQLRVQPTSANGTLQRSVLVTGVRTPFVKSFTDLMHVDSLGLGVAAVGGLMTKSKLDPKHLDELIMGNVVVSTASPNLAREIVLDLNLPRRIPGTTVSIACLSGLEAIELANNSILTGNADCIIAGGSDSLSSGEMPVPKKLTLGLGKYQLGGGNKQGWAGIREVLATAGPLSSWVPQPNSIAERSTGKTMGYHADMMAELNQIPRKDQDELAMASHINAAKAADLIKQEIVPVKTPQGKVVEKDNLIRAKQDPSKMAALSPAFRTVEQKGTVTAATSSALTDGASAVLLMSEKKAKELGYPTDISIRAYVKLAIDPFPQLLLAPALAIPRVLDKAGLKLEDIDIWEIHEAFAAQVLTTIKVLGDAAWCKQVLGRDTPVGHIDRSKVNTHGGSIAIGHPFAATGGRLVTSVINELRRSKKRYALISICAAGGIGGVMIIERQDQ